MNVPSAGDAVQHRAYGPGRVVSIFGCTATVDFFGEEYEVDASDLIVEAAQLPEVQQSQHSVDRVLLRRAYEAINLGVVPPHSDQLLTISIGGEETVKTCHRWLEDASKRGLSKVIVGNYGAGKSHYLRLCEAVALQAGWVVAFVEFDPKSADPAKPHLIYRAITSQLRFPARATGSRVANFYDFIGEARAQWDTVSAGRYFRKSPWFRDLLASARHFNHGSDRDYIDLLEWLAGHPTAYATVKKTLRGRGLRAVFPPAMPRTNETAEIYAFHLVVLNEMCQALGYKGLLLIMDEAEHVRGYNVRRRARANTFFDYLSRAAQPAIRNGDSPLSNDRGHDLPSFADGGPHFGLLVGLTEGDIFSNPDVPLREACVFANSQDDLVFLRAPQPAQYQTWCTSFLSAFCEHFSDSAVLINSAEALDKVISALSEEFALQPEHERTLRLWTKLASLVPSVLLSGTVDSLDQLIGVIHEAARATSGNLMPWELAAV